MANGAYTLDEQKKEWELGALFVRLFRSLDAVIGSNDAAARAWLNGENSGLARSADRTHPQHRRLGSCRPIPGRRTRSNLRRGAPRAGCGAPSRPSISPRPCGWSRTSKSSCCWSGILETQQAGAARRRPPTCTTCWRRHFVTRSPIGSRFRAPGDPGVWYGAEKRTHRVRGIGILALAILDGFSDGLDSLGPSPQTVFRAGIDGRMIDLTEAPFKRARSEWTDPRDLRRHPTLRARGARRRTSMRFATSRCAIRSMAAP